MKIYLVGGSVRDKLLGITLNEYDWVVVGASFKDMIDLGFKRVGKDFPVFLHPFSKEEYALARKDKKISFGYHGFDFDISIFISLNDDLFRRDLTINAIALDEYGNLIDPYFGIVDLENRFLRHISFSFKDDPVRILRISRFASKFKQFNFKVFYSTLLLMKSIVYTREVDYLVPERICSEIISASKTRFISVFLEILELCDFLELVFYEFHILYLLSRVYRYNFALNVWFNIKSVFFNLCFFIDDPYIKFSTVLMHLKCKFIYRFNFLIYFKYSKKDIDLIFKFCIKYKIPSRYKVFYSKLLCFHSFYFRTFTLKSIFVLLLLNKVNAFKDKLNFLYFLLICDEDLKLNFFIYSRVFFLKYYFLDVLNSVDSFKLSDICNFDKNVIRHLLENKKIEIINYYKVLYKNICCL